MHPDFLSFTQQWVTFSPSEVCEIARCFQPMILRKGRFFVRKGEACQQAAFIVKGVMRIFYRHKNSETTRYLGSESSFITSLGSFVSGSACQENIEALEDCELLVIQRHDMRRLCQQIHAFETLYSRVVEYMFMCTEKRIMDFITQTAEERYFTLLEQRSGLVQRVPQKYIASYIGITPQSLSRLQKTAYEREKLPFVNNLPFNAHV